MALFTTLRQAQGDQKNRRIFQPPGLVILGCAASEDLVRFSVKQKEILEAYGFKGDGWFFLRMASKNRRIFQF
jgi:hypothetical protein